MAKLGSKKHPAVVRVKTQKRAEEILELCGKHGWQVIVGLEPNKSENVSDVKKLLALSALKTTETKETKETKEIKAGRNDPCPCGSGLKFKKCCFKKNGQNPLIEENAKKWWQIWKFEK